MIPAIASGMYMGEIVGFSLSGVLVGTDLPINGQAWGGWQLVFYVFGILGILWFPYWALFAYETPDDHPYITAEEKALIRAGKDYLTVTVVGDEDSKYQGLLGPSSGESPVIQYDYRTPSMEGTNPMMRMSFSSVKSDDKKENNPFSIDGPMEDVEFATNPIHAVATSANNSFAALQQRDRTVSQEKAERESLASRIPWSHLVSHPIALTLLLNNWTYVRDNKCHAFSFSEFYLMLAVSVLGFHWIHTPVRNAFVLHRCVRI